MRSLITLALLLLFTVGSAQAQLSGLLSPPGGGVGDGGMTSGVIPKYDGSDLVDSVLSDNGTKVTSAGLIEFDSVSFPGSIIAVGNRLGSATMQTGGALANLSGSGQFNVGYIDAAYQFSGSNNFELLFDATDGSGILRAGTSTAGTSQIWLATDTNDTTNYNHLRFAIVDGTATISVAEGGTGADNIDIDIVPLGTGVVDVQGKIMITSASNTNLKRSASEPNTGAISFGNSENQLFGATATGAGSLGFYWFDRNADSATSIGGMYDATAFTTAAATVFEWRASSVTVAYLTTGGSFKTQGLVGPGDINLRTTELTVVDGDILGTITFDAPSETGADALLVTAKIHAEAAATFDATTNSTDLVLSVATDGAVVEQFRVKSTAAIHWAPRSAPPASAAAGDTYYDSDTNEFCVYNGSAWTGLIAAGACA